MYRCKSLIVTEKEFASSEKRLSICLRSNGFSFSEVTLSGVLLTFGEAEGVQAGVGGVKAGLDVGERGGDFADGVMQHLGSRLTDAPGVFLSFDRDAVKRLTARGIAASIPTAPAPAKQRK